MENENITWFEKPNLNRPYMITAFSGWANAGDVASSVLWYMISRTDATLFAEIKTDDFYSYQSNENEVKRPLVNIENGLIQSFSLVTTNFWYHAGEMGEHDLIFVSGPEPDHGWNKFADIIVDLAQEYNVEKIIALGGTFDSIPHTAPPKVTAVVSKAELKEEVENQHIELTSYKGPCSILTVLMVNATKKDIPMINLWSHTPHYIQVVNFMATYEIMQKISALSGIEIDLDIARKDAEYLRSQVDEAIEKKPELQEYLHTLEVEYHKGKPEDESPISKTIIKEIEDLFQDQQG